MQESSLSDLNPRQQEAVKTVEGPVMVLAGPGSGKTRVLTHRIAHLMRIGVPPYSILALTFTNKAAGEMKERITRLVGDQAARLWMGTFHSLLARLLRVECEKIGFQKNFSIYDAQDSLALIKRIMKAANIPAQQFNPAAIRSRISGAKNQSLSPPEYARLATDPFEEKAARIYAEYQAGLKRQNAMDFDDLLLLPLELFEGHRAVLSKYQDRFRFILVDEYQDTNRVQYTLVKLLGAKYRNVCVVGDDAQSIYAFRGADIRNILDFERDYPDAKIIRLEQNYRSTKTILAAADQVIKNNIDQMRKDLWTSNAAGDLITVLECEDDRQEAATIVSLIYEESRKLKIDLSGFAIMYRTNAQSRTLEDALRRSGVSYVIVGGIEFYQRKEIKDVLAYLRVLANNADGESLLRVVNYPPRGLGEAALNRLAEFSSDKGINLLDSAARAGEIAGLSASAKRSFTELAALFKKYRGLSAEVSVSELVRAMIDEVGILTLLKEEGTPESMARRENVHELLSAISEYADQHSGSTLEDFLQEVSLLSDVDQWDDTHAEVTLLTLHAAKGLEFPVVFISGLEEGLLPFYTSPIGPKDLEEERRLYYVGVTRAMRKLYLSRARIRYRFGDVTFQSASRFLDEIEPSLVETVDVAGRSRPQRRMPQPARSQVGTADSDSRYFSDPPAETGSDFDQPQALRIGGFVEHEIFGRGKILDLSGNGETLKAVVDFPEAGRKNLLVRYARLKIL